MKKLVGRCLQDVLLKYFYICRCCCCCCSCLLVLFQGILISFPCFFLTIPFLCTNKHMWMYITYISCKSLDSASAVGGGATSCVRSAPGSWFRSAKVNQVLLPDEVATWNQNSSGKDKVLNSSSAGHNISLHRPTTHSSCLRDIQ